MGKGIAYTCRNSEYTGVSGARMWEILAAQLEEKVIDLKERKLGYIRLRRSDMTT